MATIKVKFRASSVQRKEGALFYQVIHNRVARQVNTGYKLYPHEWDAASSAIVFPSGIEDGRRNYLVSLRETLRGDLVGSRTLSCVSNRPARTTLPKR